MAEISFNHRLLILLGSFAVALAGLALIDPIAQDPAYHVFADRRWFGGIPNFGDVASNFGFAIVGIWGIWTVAGPGGKELFPDRRDSWPWLTFFAGVALVSVGSAWYHLNPDNGRLFWDRLPMTVGFMGFFAAFLNDRIDRPALTRWLFPALVAAGILSLLYWDWTEAMGRGDLRFYGLVQFYPLVALPLVLWLFPEGRRTSGNYLYWVIFWYALAKALEHFDYEISALLGGAVSGHSLKHLAAAVAAIVVIRMIGRNGSRNDLIGG
jgi:hypothetical protein